MYRNRTPTQSFRPAWSRSKGRIWWGVVLASLVLLYACSAPTSSTASRPPADSSAPSSLRSQHRLQHQDHQVRLCQPA